MYPSAPVSDNGSNAEKKVSRLIQAQLDDSWVCLHSLGIVGHERKPWAEIDFVLIGRPGVFCLEVKGGRVARAGGKWLFTNRHNQTTEKREGPFAQAAGASSALRNYLYDRLPGLFGTIVQYGVVLPDVEFCEDGPDIEQGIVYDSRDAENRFSAYVSRLSRHWRARGKQRYGSEAPTLSDQDVAAVLKLLRRDFNLAPTLKSLVDASVDDLVRLTSQQIRALSGLSANERVVVEGSAGTGKTLLALEEARRLASEGRSVLLLCFNRRLARWLKAATKDTPGIEASSLHGLMWNRIREAGLDSRLPPKPGPEVYAHVYPELALTAIFDSPAPRHFESLVVDEAQDVLRSSYVDVLEALLEGELREGTWRFFMDQNQNLFGGVEPEAWQRLEKTKPARYTLTVNCRNTIPIALETSILSTAPLDAVLVAEGPEVRHHWFKNSDERSAALDEVVTEYLAQGVRPDQLVVLTGARPERLDLPTRAGGLTLIATDEDMTSSGKQGLLVSTIHSFKGLESEVVLLLGIESLDSSDSRAGFYVGASRARACLEVFLDKQWRTRYQERAAEFGSRLGRT